VLHIYFLKNYQNQIHIFDFNFYITLNLFEGGKNQQ